MSRASEFMNGVAETEWPYGYLYVQTVHEESPKLRVDKCELYVQENPMVTVRIGFHVLDIDRQRHSYSLMVFEDDPFQDVPDKPIFFAKIDYCSYFVSCRFSIVNDRFSVAAESIVKFIHPLILDRVIGTPSPIDKETGKPGPEWYIGLTEEVMDELESDAGIEVMSMVTSLMNLFL